MERIDQLIAQGLDGLGLLGRVPADAPEKLERYCALLLEENRHMNLTAITSPRDAACLHMLDCAALLTCPGVDFSGKTLLDVGSGGGFPGLPLKILTPSLEVTLLDSLQKRTAWLASAAAALDLEGVSVLCARAEEAGRAPELRERFDLASARAVASLRLLCELCLPFVKVGGSFLAMKGPNCDEEVREAGHALAELGGRVSQVFPYRVPLDGAAHSVIVVEKPAPTPDRYPRRWSRIKKAPI